MIIKTTIDWLDDVEMSEEELAKMDVLGEDYEPEYQQSVRRAVIDTDADKLYVEMSPEKICLCRLFGSQFVLDSTDTVRKMEERVFFKSTFHIFRLK